MRAIEKATEAARRHQGDDPYRLARAVIVAWLQDVPQDVRDQLPGYTIASAADIAYAERMIVRSRGGSDAGNMRDE